MFAGHESASCRPPGFGPKGSEFNRWPKAEGRGLAAFLSIARARNHVVRDCERSEYRRRHHRSPAWSRRGAATAWRLSRSFADAIAVNQGSNPERRQTIFDGGRIGIATF